MDPERPHSVAYSLTQTGRGACFRSTAAREISGKLIGKKLYPGFGLAEIPQFLPLRERARDDRSPAVGPSARSFAKGRRKVERVRP
jgi:hypothetical protein